MYVVVSHLVDYHFSVMDVWKMYFEVLPGCQKTCLCLISRFYTVEIVLDISIWLNLYVPRKTC